MRSKPSGAGSLALRLITCVKVATHNWLPARRCRVAALGAAPALLAAGLGLCGDRVLGAHDGPGGGHLVGARQLRPGGRRRG